MKNFRKKMISCFLGISMLASMSSVSADEVWTEPVEEYLEESILNAEVPEGANYADDVAGEADEISDGSEVFYEVSVEDADEVMSPEQSVESSSADEGNSTDGESLEDPEVWEETVELPTEEAAYDDYSAVPVPEEEENAASGEENEELLEEITEEFMIDDPIVTETSNADPEAGLVGVSEFTTSFTNYYDQLEDVAKVFYGYRKEYFGDQRKTDTLKISFDKTTAPYTFTCPVIKNAEGKSTPDTSSAEYKAGHEQMLYYLRASFDAFYYDHPEVFWTRGTGVAISYSGSISNGVATLYPKTVSIKPEEAFPGASGLISQFDAAVGETVEWIKTHSDYNGDGITEVSELLQGIHDYVTFTCYYDREGLKTYQTGTTKDSHIFTPAGVFLESVGRGVLCEGYSRAVKILCDQLGITCALVKGKSSEAATTGHQWNVVKVDGDWFLVDATWDDLNDNVRYDYYLCYQVEGRVIDSKIGGEDKSITSSGRTYTVVTKTFAYPEIPYTAHTLTLADTKDISDCITCSTYSCKEASHPDIKRYALDVHHTLETLPKVEPTCTETGLTEGKRCTVCKEVVEPQETIPAKGHTIKVNPGKEATCTETGLSDEEVCTVCGEIVKPQEVIPAKGHTAKVVPGKAATCTAAGITDGQVCSVCGITLKEQTVIPATGHNVVVDPAVPATTTSTGKTAGSHCSLCGAILVPQQITPKLEVVLKVKAKGMKNNKVTMKKGKTLQLKVTSNAKVTYSSSKKKVATVSSKGKIKAKKKGKATITVKAGNKKVKIKVTVKE